MHLHWLSICKYNIGLVLQVIQVIVLSERNHIIVMHFMFFFIAIDAFSIMYAWPDM